jgi:predicted RNA polymerase sigma factor
MIQNGGWVDTTIPTCVAPGNYLLRAEIIALHSAKNQGQAQFYVVRVYPLLPNFSRSPVLPFLNRMQEKVEHKLICELGLRTDQRLRQRDQDWG